MKRSMPNLFGAAAAEGIVDKDALLYYTDGMAYATNNEEERKQDGGYKMSMTSQLLQQVASQMSTIVGSVQFLAPEILRNIEFKPNSRSAKSKGNSLYGFSADVYSFGCVMWEVMTRKEIYKGKSYAEIQKLVLNNSRPLVLSSEIEDCPDGPFLLRLMTQCWQPDALSRPNFQQIIQMLQERRHRFMPTQKRQ